jgi:hypothetical protein
MSGVATPQHSYARRDRPDAARRDDGGRDTGRTRTRGRPARGAHISGRARFGGSGFSGSWLRCRPLLKVSLTKSIDHWSSARAALGEGRQALGIGLAGDQGVEHDPPALTEQLGQDAGDLEVGVLPDLLNAQRLLRHLAHELLAGRVRSRRAWIGAGGTKLPRMRPFTTARTQMLPLGLRFGHRHVRGLLALGIDLRGGAAVLPARSSARDEVPQRILGRVARPSPHVLTPGWPEVEARPGRKV